MILILQIIAAFFIIRIILEIIFWINFLYSGTVPKEQRSFGEKFKEWRIKNRRIIQWYFISMFVIYGYWAFKILYLDK